MSTLTFNLLLRYRYIEIIALWEGSLRTKHLCQTFNIGRQQASKDINQYNNEIAPNNLFYDRSMKSYVPSDTFIPKVTSGVLDEYLSFSTDATDSVNILKSICKENIPVETIKWPSRYAAPRVVRSVVQAIKRCNRIEVDYVSVQKPDREGRIIVPHALAFTGDRWHVRAWCEKNQDYRDFALSRFRGEPELLGKSAHNRKNDVAWQTKVTMEIIPNPSLSPEQQKVVAEDYAMSDGKLAITLRAQLIPYAINLLHLVKSADDSDPLANQLVLLNRHNLHKWLSF